MLSLKIGFLGITSNLLWGDPSVKMYEQSKKLLSELAKRHQVISADEFFNDSSDGLKKITKFIEGWEDTRFDLIIIQSVGFGVGIGPVDIALTQTNTPIVMWAVSEPEFKEGGLLEKNSWCGVNMHTSHLYKLDAKYEFIYGTPEDKNVRDGLKDIIKVAEVIKKLHHTSIGAIGGRVPGYFNSNFDELALRKSLGIKFEFIDISEVLAEFGKITESELKENSNKIYFGKRIDIDENINNSTKLFISIKRIIERYNLSAVALKCWPDFQNLLGITSCSVMGALGDEFVPVSCEGDMLGAVSMLIMSSFNNDVSSSMDISDFNYIRNSFYAYHCGSCPTKMAMDKTLVEHRAHSLFENKCGIVSEFYLRTGSCGVLRLSEDKVYRNKYRMFFAEGDGIKGTYIRGNNLEIKLKNSDVKKFIETVIKNGFAHHYALGYDINREVLLIFCRWLDIETFFI